MGRKWARAFGAPGDNAPLLVTLGVAPRRRKTRAEAGAGSAGWPSVESMRVRRPRGATAHALYERDCNGSAERVRAHAPLDGRAPLGHDGRECASAARRHT